jgi:hypothetical protein
MERPSHRNFDLQWERYSIPCKLSNISWCGEIPSCVPTPGLIYSHDFSSVIFNRLLKTPEDGLLYFFFNHSDREQSAEHVTRVLLRQLLSQLDAVPEDVLLEYSHYKKHLQMPPRETFERLLKLSLESFIKSTSSRVFILVDAYDELLSSSEERGDKAALERAAVCTCLSQLGEIHNVKMLITTRPQYCGELQTALPNSKMAAIHGDRNDMELYLQTRLMPLRLPDSLKAIILDKLVKANEDEKW